MIIAYTIKDEVEHERLVIVGLFDTPVLAQQMVACLPENLRNRVEYTPQLPHNSITYDITVAVSGKENAEFKCLVLNR